jgi:phospholipase/lecithinase/hemolysin
MTADFVVTNIVNPTAISFDICANYAVRNAALVASARAASAAYNAIIAAEASVFGAVVVDINSLFADLARNGIEVGGHHLTTQYLGGLFSLDAIHPTNTGYAIMANEVIKTMNRTLAAGIPPISIEQVAKTDPLIPPKL